VSEPQAANPERSAPLGASHEHRASDTSANGDGGPVSGRLDIWDGELVRRMGSDDRAEALDALDELFRRHGRAVLSFSLHSLERPACAEQVVNDVFAELFTRRKALALNGDSIRSHLVTLAHQRCTELPAAARSQAREAPAAGSPGRSREALSPEQRLAIDLASLGKMSCAQVAALLGRSEAQVKALIQGGLSQVANAILRDQQHGPAAGPAATP
jgi:DNA-directed RNA polymerase specialized sigma24 family protein